jgi:hypothetical protein
MAALTTVSANDLLNYIYRGVVPDWGGATTLYLSLHTGTIGAGGDQTTNEVAYTGYARVAFSRTSGGLFTAASGGQITSGSLVLFGLATAGSFPIVATHGAIGVAASGAGKVLKYAAHPTPIIINAASRPEYAVGTIVGSLI